MGLCVFFISSFGHAIYQLAMRALFSESILHTLMFSNHESFFFELEKNIKIIIIILSHGKSSVIAVIYLFLFCQQSIALKTKTRFK